MRRGALLVFVLYALAAEGTAAGKRVVLTWDQNADCEEVAKWEAFAGKLPAAATSDVAVKLGELLNVAPTICGAGVSSTFVVGWRGLTRFWVRAVAVDGEVSDFSNSLDKLVPLGSPENLR